MLLKKWSWVLLLLITMAAIAGFLYSYFVKYPQKSASTPDPQTPIAINNTQTQLLLNNCLNIKSYIAPKLLNELEGEQIKYLGLLRTFQAATAVMASDLNFMNLDSSELDLKTVHLYQLNQALKESGQAYKISLQNLLQITCNDKINLTKLILETKNQQQNFLIQIQNLLNFADQEWPLIIKNTISKVSDN